MLPCVEVESVWYRSGSLLLVEATAIAGWLVTIILKASFSVPNQGHPDYVVGR